MNNTPSLKSNRHESPKTPGGISKSLLTPCRRLGLSRNWRKSGPSPFISPLASSDEIQQERTCTRKRKECSLNDEVPSPPTSDGDKTATNSINIDSTPTRNVDLPRRKKSKTLLSVLNKSEKCRTKSTHNNEIQSPSKNPEELHKDVVATPVSLKSSGRKNVSPKHTSSKENYIKQNNTNNLEVAQLTKNEKKIGTTEKSPSNLTKECMVVIQKKIFNEDIKVKCTENTPVNNKQKNSASQTLFDSDSDEVPLSSLNKKVVPNIIKPINSINKDDDFVETKEKFKKIESSKPLIAKTNSKTKYNTKIQPKHNILTSKPSSQSSVDDDDEDFAFEDKRTILIRKTYNKVQKPLKAKSTGSITQKDIDELKSRIEAKKKILLAKAMTEDTKELRDLIKKWQKGCQDALMELMDLMKTKFPDKQNMDYSEMLKMLKIPSSLVGYDSDSDCFNTPDDARIILAKFNDL